MQWPICTLIVVLLLIGYSYSCLAWPVGLITDLMIHSHNGYIIIKEIIFVKVWVKNR